MNKENKLKVSINSMPDYGLTGIKYLDLQKLTPSIMNDTVKRAYVYSPQVIDGKRTQQIDICYDLVGILPISLLKQNGETA